MSDAFFADRFSFLVVDDHDFMRRLITETLNSAQAGKVDSASNGEEAIERLIWLSKVDFIITDFNMPVMNGLTFLQAIRTGQANTPRDTPVIMLSGFDDEPLLVTAMKLDTSGFIKKSVSKNELVARMNSIFMGETKIKSIEEYQKVTLPSIEGAFRHESPSIKKSASAIRLPANIKSKAVRTPLEKITPGSLVADDIVTASGNIILSEGDKVTNQLIEFLVQTKDITKISTLLVVNL